MSRKGFHLNPVDLVDLDELPGLDSVVPDSYWRECAARVVQNILNPDTPPDTLRTIKIVVAFRPEADLRSFVCGLKSPLAPSLPGTAPPRPRRMVMDRAHNRLTLAVANAEPVEISAFEPPPVDLESIPTLSELWKRQPDDERGELDDAWRRALVRVCLSIDDPRSDPKGKREIQIQVGVDTDDARSIIRWHQVKVLPVIAPSARPNPDVLYLETDDRGICRLEREPLKYLPDGQTGRQSTLPPSGNVVPINRS